MTPYYCKITYRNVTWFIHSYWLVLAAFILGVSVSAIIKVCIQQKLKNSRDITQNPDELRGGYIEDYIEPDKVYEVINPQLKIIIMKMYTILFYFLFLRPLTRSKN